MRLDRQDRGGVTPIASLREISRVLEETARIVRQHAERRDEAEAEPLAEIGATQVRAILALRALRRKHLGIEVSDAAWPMMLELYAARLEGRLVYQTRLAVDAAVPQTTALNTVRRLIELGVFVSSRHPDDKRLLVVSLSDSAADRLGGFLAAAGRMALLA